MAEKSRRLPSWIGNQSVSSSTSSSTHNARSPANDLEEVRDGGSDCSNGAHDVPSSSGASSSGATRQLGPLRVVYDRDEVVDSCRSSNADNVSSGGNRQIVSGTSDRTTKPEHEDEQVDSTSDGTPAGPNAPDSSHDVRAPDDNQAQVDSSGLNSNQDEVSSGQPSQPRDSCFYGSSCYRRNPQHRQEFSHPGEADYVEPSSTAPNTKPVCRYGQGCYRRNPKHRRDYNHDVAPVARAARPTTFRDADESTDEDFDSGSSDEYSPGDSDTDDSFVVSDSVSESGGSDTEYSPNRGNATNGNDRPNRKQGKRRKKHRDRASKKTKH